MKTHNCATSTISVGSSTVREKHSHASINFLSCSSTTFPSHCLLEVLLESCTLLWPSRSECYCCNFQKGYLLLRERLTSQYGHLVFSKDVTNVIGSNRCGLTLGSQFGEDWVPCCKLAFKSRIFVARKGVLAGKSLVVALLLYCFKMPLQIPFLRQSYRCIADQTNMFWMRINKNDLPPVCSKNGTIGLDSFRLSYVNVQDT